MKYMLDTNICVYAIKHKPAEVIERLVALNAEDVCISSITYAELMYGVSKSKTPSKNRLAFSLFLSPFTVLDYDQDAAMEYGDIRAGLENLGTPIGPMDTLIAAHARSQGLILVTHNTREFNRVQDLMVEDWVTNE